MPLFARTSARSAWRSARARRSTRTSPRSASQSGSQSTSCSRSWLFRSSWTSRSGGGAALGRSYLGNTSRLPLMVLRRITFPLRLVGCPARGRRRTARARRAGDRRRRRRARGRPRRPPRDAGPRAPACRPAAAAGRPHRAGRVERRRDELRPARSTGDAEDRGAHRREAGRGDALPRGVDPAAAGERARRRRPEQVGDARLRPAAEAVRARRTAKCCA